MYYKIETDFVPDGNGPVLVFLPNPARSELPAQITPHEWRNAVVQSLQRTEADLGYQAGINGEFCPGNRRSAAMRTGWPIVDAAHVDSAQGS
jgi:hypothetical protein